MDEENSKADENSELTTNQTGIDVNELIKKNLEMTEEILKMTKKIKNFVFWQRILGVIKLVIIVIPLVLGLIYLPALLDNVIKPYQELLNIGGQASSGIEDLNLNNIDLDKVRSLLK